MVELAWDGASLLICFSVQSPYGQSLVVGISTHVSALWGTRSLSSAQKAEALGFPCIVNHFLLSNKCSSCILVTPLLGASAQALRTSCRASPLATEWLPHLKLPSGATLTPPVLAIPLWDPQHLDFAGLMLHTYFPIISMCED